MEKIAILARGLPLNPMPEPKKTRDPSVPHAPKKQQVLNEQERILAVKNALRYFPEEHHAVLAPEFAEELAQWGHIYMYRFMPTEYEMKAYNIALYPAKCLQAAGIMMMIMNNLDKAVAQFPHELITYGGNGSVFSNWAQYLLVMKYLSQMTDQQTLSMYSGHPMGLFPSHHDAPRVVVTNGMVIPNYSSKDMYEKMYAQGVSMYGQMTAGSYAYIGPQGIVHGTTLTILNAGRKYLGLNSLAGKIYVTSGLGGMSGAQGKAVRITGCVGLIAEVNIAAIEKRHAQGWVDCYFSDVTKVIEEAKKAVVEKKSIAIAYHGNIITLLEKLNEHNLVPELGSDQTSLHNPYNGGYYPVQISFEEANKLMVNDTSAFKDLVKESLKRHAAAVNTLCARGMRFWDYGNSFLLESGRAGADIFKADGKTFKYPSYVQDIMGDIFSLGFGPFRWICASGERSDLEKTDKIAAEIIEKLKQGAPEKLAMQYNDNYIWILQALGHNLVVGSQARILYSDAPGRAAIAEAFNDAIQKGELKGPVILSRDHHDVSGTDSPFRETSNIYDGSSFCADMAVQNFVGDSFRGATWISLHNGGGVGWGEVINGGFGMLLDGKPETRVKARRMLTWDVNNGVSRRAWAGNDNAEFCIARAMESDPNLVITMPNHAKEDLVEKALNIAYKK